MRKYKTGFTLIELLFVIAIVAALSVTGIVYYQQRMQNQKIEKTVAQIQQWLQAGVAYHMDNGKWPANISDLTDKQKPYIPNYETAADSNPWCNKKPCYAIAVQGGLFNVTATINAPDNIVKTIAGRLPYAAVVGNKVTSRVNIPGIGGNFALMRVEFRELSGKDFQQSTPPGGTDSERYLWLKREDSVTRPFPSCSRYNKGNDKYMLAAYPIQFTSYFSAPEDPVQPRAFSLLRVFSVSEARVEGNFSFHVFARPQHFWTHFVHGERWSAIKDENVYPMKLVVQFFFVCEKYD